MVSWLNNLSLRWKFMLVPLTSILLMTGTGGTFIKLAQHHEQVLSDIQSRDSARAQTLIELSHRLAANHTQVYELLRTAEQNVDEGTFYDKCKPYLYEIHRVEDVIKELLKTDDPVSWEAERETALLANIASYRVSTTNAMLMATVDLGLAKNVMSNATKQFNQLNADFLSLDKLLQSQLIKRLAEHKDQSTDLVHLFLVVFAAILVATLAIAYVLSNLLSRDINALITRLGTLVSAEPAPESRAANEVATLDAIIGGVQENHAYLEATRNELDATNRRLSESYETIVEREIALATANEALEEKIEELHGTIEERDEAEEALRRSQKLEAIGQLTGGVAHDFNNLLGVIVGNAELLEDWAQGDDAAHDSIAAILLAATGGAALTGRLLAFSRQQPLVPVSTDITALIGGMEDMLQRTLGEAVEVTVPHSNDLWPVIIDPHQFENALLNLAINARDAMPDGGKLIIETLNTTLDAAYAKQRQEVVPGDYVQVAISDSGSGMSPETLERAFEPFFTTKDIGKGSGLGLSMVYGFIKQSIGHISIYSEEGQGTTVRLYLPKSVEIAGTVPRAEETATLVRGSERILLVEDAEAVREISVKILRDQGYHVIEATNGAEAIARVQSDGPFDLLFTDVVLPGGMNGVAVAEAVKQLQPSIKTLYTTGYAENAIVHNGRLDPGVALINKPYRRAELLRKVREVLDGHDPDDGAEGTDPPPDTANT